MVIEGGKRTCLLFCFKGNPCCKCSPGWADSNLPVLLCPRTLSIVTGHARALCWKQWAWPRMYEAGCAPEYLPLDPSLRTTGLCRLLRKGCTGESTALNSRGSPLNKQIICPIAGTQAAMMMRFDSTPLFLVSSSDWNDSRILTPVHQKSDGRDGVYEIVRPQKRHGDAQPNRTCNECAALKPMVSAIC